MYIGYMMSAKQRKVDRARAEGRVVLERQGPLGVAAAFVDLARYVHTQVLQRREGRMDVLPDLVR